MAGYPIKGQPAVKMQKIKKETFIMKKFLATLFTLTFIVTVFSACGKNQPETETTESSETSSTTESQSETSSETGSETTSAASTDKSEESTAKSEKQTIKTENSVTSVKNTKKNILQGKETDDEGFSKYKEAAMEKEKELEINSKKVTINKTTMKEMTDNGFDFDTTSLDESAEISYTTQTLKNDESISFDFYNESYETYGDMVLYSVSGNEGREISIEGTKAVFGKTTLENFINNGWTVKKYYKEEDSMLPEFNTVEAVMSKNGTSVLIEFLNPNSKDVLSSVLYSIY